MSTWDTGEVAAQAAPDGHVCVVAMQGQGSMSMPMADITTREHGDVLGWGSYWGQGECPGVVPNWPSLSLVLTHWRAGGTSRPWHPSGELVLCLVTVELALVVECG